MTTIPLADRPGTNPEEDLFGYAPFAKRLADSICRCQGDDGLVFAVYGPWGSGKTTVMNYVKHYLAELSGEAKPVVVDFNPWWFTGQENLARIFIGQLQAVLPTKNAKLKRLGDLLGEFGESLGGLIDLSGVTGGAASRFGKFFGAAFKRKPKDVPALKAEISTILKEANKRIVVVIDDIDRLTPEEMCQVFNVVKALADFPNVIYMLAFDKNVAKKSIALHLKVSGLTYLEKIIQIPFELPYIGKSALKMALDKRINKIIQDNSHVQFDQLYWDNICSSGLIQLFKLPRDIVRFTNKLFVTYPAVCGRVNPVDFIALEAIHFFIPRLYDIIKENQEQFAGYSQNIASSSSSTNNKLLNDFLIEVGYPIFDNTTIILIENLFPKVAQQEYGEQEMEEWRNNLRVCHPDIFPRYFYPEFQ